MLTDLLSEAQPSSLIRSVLVWVVCLAVNWPVLISSVQLTVLIYRWTDKLQRTQPAPLTVGPSLEHTTVPNKGGDTCCPLSKNAQKIRSNYSKWRLIQFWTLSNKTRECPALTRQCDHCVNVWWSPDSLAVFGLSCCTARRGSSAGDTVERVKRAPPGTDYDNPEVRLPVWMWQVLSTYTSVHQ